MLKNEKKSYVRIEGRGLERVLKGHRFDSIAATTKALNSIPETDFQRLLTSGRRAELSVSMQEESILKFIK